MNDTVHNSLRQTVTALVALTLVLSVLGPVGTVAADPAVSIEQTADNTAVAPGDTVTLTTTFEAADVNGPLVELAFPDGWEGTVTDSAGGAVNPSDETGTVLPSNAPAVVWLSAGTYEVTTEVQVPDDATPGEYTLSATGSGVDPTDDDDGVADEDDEIDTTATTVTVQAPDQNEPPTASFTASPDSPDAGETVSFDASTSSDADGSIASYEWAFGDGDTATGESAGHAYDAAGDYDVTLTVTDDDGATAQTTQTVSVSEAPVPASFQVSNLDVESPVTQGDDASVTATVENVGEEGDTQTISLAVEGSEVDSQSLTLSGGDGQQVNFAVDTAGLSVGNNDVTLSTDDDSASATLDVTPDAPENQPPTADAGDDQTVEENGSVTLDAAASSDPDGDGLSYDWTQTGGAAVGLSDDDTATPSFTAPDVDGEETLTFEVEVSDGEATDTDTVAVTVADTETEPPTDGPSAEVGLSPDSDLVAVGDSAEYDITVDDAEGGVGVYSMTVAVDDPSVASISGVDLASLANEELADVQIAEDGSSATIEAVLVDTSDTGSVTLGTVTVESAAEGTTGVSLDVSELGDESGNAYTVTATSGATLEASTLVVGGSESPAQDPDGDGVYEDVNGDGTVDVLDVQTLFADRDGAAAQNSPEAFDFNGDGEFSLLDIQTLFAEETG
ncbi:PKD domain-containing protein [Halorubrum sp. Atlit-26R]|uniref:PKD domain-containing protein n=1 Tax=Halorubrum sp. Atlit-26R TaxID=2282128 RepID=UPI0013147D34|nr:PKD domain-containing protein [Halorubrum sp. Atlit-26R]